MRQTIPFQRLHFFLNTASRILRLSNELRDMLVLAWLDKLSKLLPPAGKGILLRKMQAMMVVPHTKMHCPQGQLPLSVVAIWEVLCEQQALPS